MPGPTQRTLAVIAVLTGSLPLAVGAVIAAARGELPGAAACAGAAALIAAPLAIRDSRWFRAVCLVVGLPILGFCTAAVALGGILGMPAALALVSAGAIPARWPLWKGLLAPVAGVAAAFAGSVGAYFAYSCLRPTPILVALTAEPVDDLETHVGFGGITSFRSTGDGYEWEFERGATGERDRVAARLRDRAGVESVSTRDERCD